MIVIQGEKSKWQRDVWDWGSFDYEDDADFEEDRNYEGRKKFDTRLTRVWSESIEGKGAAALLAAKNLFCLLISARVGASFKIKARMEASFAYFWPHPHPPWINSQSCVFSIHSNNISSLPLKWWVKHGGQEEIFGGVLSNQVWQRPTQMIPHFLSPIRLCRHQVASITLGPHLITEEATNWQRNSSEMFQEYHTFITEKSWEYHRFITAKSREYHGFITEIPYEFHLIRVEGSPGR